MDKYYTLYLNKKIDKNNSVAMRTFKFIQPMFTSTKSEYLYVRPFSGTIKCCDAFYVSKLENMPIIVRANEEGYFDFRTGTPIEIYEPIRIKDEVSIDLVNSCNASLNQDHISGLNYEEAIKEYVNIVESYKQYITKNIGIDCSYFKLPNIKKDNIEEQRQRSK